MRPSGATYLSVVCCFSDLALYNTIQRVGQVERVPHHHRIEN
jgi:hypothetical protein